MTQNTSLPTSTSPAKSCKNRRAVCIACGACVGLILLLVIILAIVASVVYKVRDPTMNLDSVKISSIFAPTGGIAKELTVSAIASVMNPNALALTYKSSESGVYYRGRLIGQTVGPGGVAPAKKTVVMTSSFNIKSSDLLSDKQFFKEFIKGEVAFNTSTYVGGKVTAFGVINKHVDLLMNCTMTINSKTLSLKNQTCWTKLDL